MKNTGGSSSNMAKDRYSNVNNNESENEERNESYASTNAINISTPYNNGNRAFANQRTLPYGVPVDFAVSQRDQRLSELIANVNNMLQTSTASLQSTQLAQSFLNQASSTNVSPLDMQQINNVAVQLMIASALDQQQRGILNTVQRQVNQLSHQQQQQPPPPPNRPLLPSMIQSDRSSTQPSLSFASIPPRNMVATPAAAAASPQQHAIPPVNRPVQSRGKQTFPMKFYEILENSDQYGDIIHWSQDGFSFVIEDPQRFTQEVASQMFRFQTYGSFIRQLNFYGFEKLDWGCLIGTYRHENMRRGRPDLAAKIKRKKPRNKKDEE